MVVDRDMDAHDITEEIDFLIGVNHVRHYPYCGMRDVVYLVEEEDIERVGELLEKINSVFSYNFNDPA